MKQNTLPLAYSSIEDGSFKNKNHVHYNGILEIENLNST